MNHVKIIIGAAIGVALVFAATVWPTAYRWQVLRMGEAQVIVVINRFTGSTSVFHPSSGWRQK